MLPGPRLEGLAACGDGTGVDVGSGESGQHPVRIDTGVDERVSDGEQERAGPARRVDDGLGEPAEPFDREVAQRLGETGRRVVHARAATADIGDR